MISLNYTLIKGMNIFHFFQPTLLDHKWIGRNCRSDNFFLSRINAMACIGFSRIWIGPACTLFVRIFLVRPTSYDIVFSDFIQKKIYTLGCSTQHVQLNFVNVTVIMNECAVFVGRWSNLPTLCTYFIIPKLWFSDADDFVLLNATKI